MILIWRLRMKLVEKEWKVSHGSNGRGSDGGDFVNKGS